MEPKDYLSSVDPVLAKVIQLVDLKDIESTHNVFHDLMSCLIEQQIHYRSTKHIFKKLLEKAEIEILTPLNFNKLEPFLTKDFNLSGSKYDTIFAVIEYWEANESNIELVNLIKIKGIGQQTIDMLSLFTFGHKNIFPVDDYHLKPLMTSLYGLNLSLNLRAQMIDISQKWDGFKSLAVRYLLGYLEIKKKK
jgi:DNA-3-methyladenine glycosylase II